MEYVISDKMKNMKPSAIREIFKSLQNPAIIAFSAGNPSPDSFPKEAIREIAADIFANDANAALQYSITEGYPPLRNAVKQRLESKFGIGRAFDTTIITTGGQQGLDLTAKVLCNEGDVVLCENPSFIGGLNAFRSFGAKLVGIDMESDGINIEKLEQALQTNTNVRFLYVIPTFHNPTGITMSLEKRKAVYALAKKYGVLILEDNPYGELRFAGENLPTIKSMDEDGIVIYCSSFSKILSAGIRLGYVCGPDAVVQKMVVAKQVEDVHTNIFFQMLCYRYMTEYDFDGHIGEIQTLYQHKCTLMLQTLEKEMPKSVTFTHPEGGLFLWCTLPKEIDLGKFIKKAIENLVAVVPGIAFNCDESAPSDSFRMTYATPSDEQIIEGVKRLASVVKSFETQTL